MARMSQLDPAPRVVLDSGDWELLATEAGRYGTGLRGTIQLWDGERQLKTAVALDLVEPQKRTDFARAVSAESGLDPREIEKALLDLIAAIEAILRQQTRQSRRPDHEGIEEPYIVTQQGLIWLKSTQHGIMEKPLTNFAAEIVADTLVDDGVETRRVFTLRTTLGTYQKTFDVPAASFAAMTWPTEYLGAAALIYPGQTLRDHARAAVQMLSRKIIKRDIFAHLGWRYHEGTWHYLHAEGAIGSEDAGAEIDVRLPEELTHYTLPLPENRAALEQALRASMHMLRIGPPEVMLPIYASIWLAALGCGALSVFLVGRSGVGKTALASLAQQHFGAGMNAENLPANWTSSANALEALAFAAKDALMTIDEFTPTDSLQAQTLHRTAERLLRAQANRTGRQRMRADTTLRPSKPPRGLLLATGEDVPKGQSLRARMIIIEVEPDTVDWEALTRCQAEASAALYAQALAGFVQWLAPRYDTICRRLPRVLVKLRQKALQSEMHRRTPENIARLALGWGYFLHFARAIGVLHTEEVRQQWDEGWQTLGKVAQIQTHYLATLEPTRRFMELLREALVSGKAFLATPDGTSPCPPPAYGWRKSYADADTYQPQGTKIGWIDSHSLYLLPDASYAVAQTLGREVGDALVVSPQTLRKRLKEKNLLASVDSARQTLTVRRVLERKTQNVLHMFTETLYDNKPDKPDSDSVNGVNAEGVADFEATDGKFL